MRSSRLGIWIRRAFASMHDDFSFVSPTSQTVRRSASCPTAITRRLSSERRHSSAVRCVGRSVWRGLGITWRRASLHGWAAQGPGPVSDRTVNVLAIRPDTAEVMVGPAPRLGV